MKFFDRCRPRGILGVLLDVVGVVCLLVAVWWIKELAISFGWGAPYAFYGVTHTAIFVEGVFSSITAMIHAISSTATVLAVLWLLFKLARLTGLLEIPTRQLKATGNRIRRPDIPQKNPGVFSEGDSFVVRGKYNSPWGQWALSHFVDWFLLLWLLYNLVDFGMMASKIETPMMWVTYGLLTLLNAKSWISGGYSGLIILPIFAAVYFAPLILSKILPWQWLLHHTVAPLLPKKNLAVEFDKDGVRVGSGASASTLVYPYSQATFRLVDHPRIRNSKSSIGSLDPFVAAGRVELVVGERTIILADISRRDQAADFVAACHWAMLQHAQIPRANRGNASPIVFTTGTVTPSREESLTRLE